MSIQKMFKRPEKYSQSGVKNPATPAEKAAAVWDRRVGSAVTQAYNWRRATILMGIACLVLAGGLVVQSLKTQCGDGRQEHRGSGKGRGIYGGRLYARRG